MKNKFYGLALPHLRQPSIDLPLKILSLGVRGGLDSLASQVLDPLRHVRLGLLAGLMGQLLYDGNGAVAPVREFPALRGPFFPFQLRKLVHALEGRLDVAIRDSHVGGCHLANRREAALDVQGFVDDALRPLVSVSLNHAA